MDGCTPEPKREAKHYKSDLTPIWCPGCGHFGVHAALNRALAELQLDPAQVVISSGIGCSSRIPAYTNCYGFHGLHGRALPLAIGLKLARPDLTVIAAGGDGDGFSIGGNHFIHACRRNVNLTYIVMDNEVYGMTKGQPSPTTAPDWDSDLQPGGTGISSFRPLGVALQSGANYVARGFSGDLNGLTKLIVQGIRHPGFSFVHVLSPCVTFRPEQREWKSQTHPSGLAATPDFHEASRRLADDDGLTTGALYIGDRKPYAPAVAPLADTKTNLAHIVEEFSI
ncbi:MAG: 2-oxoacid:ferredoxin oxidoreductase subunit beta [Rhodospirillaceae bacterium]